ncbi:MAG: hypothetical protein AB7H92_01210 [Microbacteriaceae bacterium]
MARLLVALAAVGLGVALSGCVGAPAEPVDPGPAAPIGPVPPPSGPLTLERIAGIVSEDDGPPTTRFTPGGTLSTSGADLESEQQYWVAVGGTPDVCADVVAAPYLVSSADAADRDGLDDRSVLLGTFTELDEERFGLIQVYAREFDDDTAAQGFLSGFEASVAACPGYRFLDDGVATYDAVALSVEQLAPAGDGEVAALEYRETLDTADHRTTVYFLQRDRIVISIYGEILPSSTITDADLESLTGTVALRFGEV